MTPANLISLFRYEVADVADPYLWKQPEVEDYLIDAQQTFTRLIGGIRDASSIAAQVALVAGEALSPVHSSVIRIHSARLASNNNPIDILSMADLYLTQNTARALRFSPAQINLPGPVKALVTDASDGYAQAVQVPEVDDTVLLVVDRMPLTNPIEEKEFEIREEHHRKLLVWMKFRAYNKHDADTFDKVKAAEFEQEFYRYCAEAKAEKERRYDKPRMINYGGI
jgi:hypothetical protein